MLSTNDIEKKILSLSTERYMYFAPLTLENVGTNRICDVRYLSEGYEDIVYDEVFESECKGYGMFMLDESKQMTASVVLCNNTTDELTGPYIELSLLCSKMEIKTGQGKIMALLAMFYSYFLFNKNRIYLKFARKNADKLIPFYSSLGFTRVSPTSLVMFNNDIKTFIESYDFDKLRLKTQS